MKKFLKRTATVLILLYIAICLLLFFFQEKLIFFPEKLSTDYRFGFLGKFEEINIKVEKDVNLDGLLFKADHSKGVIFYLHGNAGSLRSWGEVAATYTAMNYDVFIIDYRGYGKSDGSINGEEQVFHDLQIAYDFLKREYTEEKIIVLGYSIGTGPAAKIASLNHPGLLILQAPYFSLSDMMKHYYPVIPTFILKYKFETNEYIKNCSMPIVIFHGTRDNVIYYNSSVKLKQLLKSSDTLITLEGQGHNGMTRNPEYVAAMEKILGQ